MVWALRTNGINSYMNGLGIGHDPSVSWTLEFKRTLISPSGGWYREFGGSTTANRLIIKDDLTELRHYRNNTLFDFTGLSLALDDTIKLVAVNGSRLELFVNNVSQGFSNNTGTVVGISYERYGNDRSIDFCGSDLESIKFTTGTTANNRDFDATLSDHDTNPPVLTELINGNDATCVNGCVWVDLGGDTTTVTASLSSYSYSANSAQIELSGEISVTTAPASYQYNPKIATVDLTGELNVLAGIASYTYSENQSTISLTGNINISPSTATYNYQSLKAAIDLTGEIVVNQALASYAYFPLPASVETVSTISVSASTPTYNYQANTATIDITGTITVNSAAESYLYQSAYASISLFGEINVSAELASYNYSALSATIGTGDVQQIGSVSTSFKESPYTVKYKLNNITVNFKG